MSILYNRLAAIYDDMYQSLFDYDTEARFYTDLLRQELACSVLEVGCGTGHLAQRLLAAGFAYQGMDLSADMLVLARQNLAEAGYTEGVVLRQGDMRSFKLDMPVDAILITGRSLSYLTTEQDVKDCFSSVCAALKPQGCLIFDAIDAVALWAAFAAGETQQTLETAGKIQYYKRLSHNQAHENGRTWTWTAQYYSRPTAAADWTAIGSDTSVLRAFSTEELRQYLAESGLRLEAVFPKNTYTWQDAYFLCHNNPTPTESIALTKTP